MKLIQEGNRKARIVFVGEAPGAQEAAYGKPFVGGSGELLNYMLSRSHIGIRRSDTFITNVCHVQPPENNFKWFFKKGNQHHLVLGATLLKRDLEAIRPNLVVALGGQALRVLTGKDGIDKYRGSILPSTLVPGIKVIGTYHPAFLLRSYDYKAVAEMDLMRAAQDQHFPELRYPRRHMLLGHEWYIRDEEGGFTRDVMTTMSRVSLMEEMYQAEWLSVDIECVQDGKSGKWRLSCVGFSDRPDRCLVVPVLNSEDRFIISHLCASPAKKLCQNGTFDATVLEQDGIVLNNYDHTGWDTMLAHHSLYPECAGSEDEVSMLKKGQKRSAAIKKGLAFLASVNTREPFYKDDGKLWQGTGDLLMFWRYNGLDACVTREIRDVQAQDLQAYGTDCVLKHEMSLVRPLMRATHRGIRIDTALRARMREHTESEIGRLQLVLDAMAGFKVNVKSNPDMKKLLYEKLNLPIRRNPQGKKNEMGELPITANKDAIIDLAEKFKNPALLSILAIRERRDIIERYLDTPIDSDGRMRCSFDITGTRTGRLSSRASIFGSGSNLQNQPPEIRQCFIADPGKVFVYRDYAQAEARVVAYLARCQALIDIFEDPTRDVHKENASRIYDVPISGVTGDMRQEAKRGVHSANYGVGAARTVAIVNQSSAETGIVMTFWKAKKILETYFMLYPEIKDIFWYEVVRDLKYNRTLNTPFGRKRTFYGRWESAEDSKFLNAAYSYIPQSTIGDLCCKALVAMDQSMIVNEATRIPDTDVLLNVHDSLLVQTPIEYAEKVADRMAQDMRIPITIHGKTFYIPTDCKVGFNWMDVDKKDPEKNPWGLRDISKWIDAGRPVPQLVAT